MNQETSSSAGRADHTRPTEPDQDGQLVPLPASDRGPAPRSAGEGTASAGRGGLALAVGKLYFLAIGLVQQVLLKQLLGLAGYGAYSTASSVASITYNPVVQASIQGVSREIASHDASEQGATLRRVLVWHTLLALGLALLFVALAGVATSLLGAPHLTTTLRILGTVLFSYGVYAPLVGALNGLRRFVAQAAVDVIAATLRTAGLLGGAYLGLRLDRSGALEMSGVEGAALGFSGVSLLLIGLGIWLAGVGRSGGASLTFGKYARFLWPVLLGQLLVNLLFQADALVLRRLGSAAAELAILDASAADPLVGAYRAAQLFCFLPYQLLMSVTFILFPLLAAASAEGNSASVTRTTAAGVRLAALVTALMVAPLVAVPGGLVALVYGKDAALLVAPAMRILAVGLAAFALFGVMTTALNALGRPRTSLLVTSAAVVLVFGLTVLFGYGAPLSHLLLERVATGATIAMLGATLLAGWQLASVAGSSLSRRTALRTAGASLSAGMLLAQLTPGGNGHAGPVMTLALALVAVAGTLALLVVTGEVGRSDLDGARSLLRRKRSG